MSLTVAELVATLGLEDKTFRRGLDQIGGLLASGAIIAGLNRVEEAASNLQQAAGGTSAVFGDMASIIDAAAKDSAQSMGLSERAFRESTSRIGALLKGMGYDTRAAAEESIRLTQVGADLAATFGGTTAEAVDALAAALRGEMDPIERYGISLRQADVEAKAMALGLWDGTGAIDAHAKAQASLAIITEKSGGALGQFAREADSAAGQAQISAAKMENAQANLGEALLPIYAKISAAVGSLADFFGALPGPAQTAILALAGIAAVAGPVNATVQTVKSLATAIETAAANGSSLASGLQRMAGPMAAAGIAVAGAATAMAIWNRAVQEAKDTAEEGGSAIRESFISGVTTADEFGRSLGYLADQSNEFGDASRQAWNPTTQENMGRAADAVTDVHNEMAALIPVINALAEETGNADAATVTILQNIDAVTRALAEGYTPAEAAALAVTEENASAQQRATVVTEAFGEETSAAATAHEELTKAIDDAVDAARAAIDPFFGMLDAINGNAEAQAALAEAQASGTASAEELAQLNQQVAESALDVEEASLRLASAVQDGTVSVDAARSMLDRWVQQGLISEDTAANMAFMFGAAAGEADRLAGDRVLNFRANTSDAVRAIQELQRQAAGVAANSYEINFNAGRGGPRAAGGRVEAGLPRPVGELGTEWFVPDTAGTIVNAQQVRDMENAGSRGGGLAVAGDLVLQTIDSPKQWLDELGWRDWRTTG